MKNILNKKFAQKWIILILNTVTNKGSELKFDFHFQNVTFMHLCDLTTPAHRTKNTGHLYNDTALES